MRWVATEKLVAHTRKLRVATAMVLIATPAGNAVSPTRKGGSRTGGNGRLPGWRKPPSLQTVQAALFFARVPDMENTHVGAGEEPTWR